MRIGLDATPLATPTGGIRRYLSELAAALSNTFGGDELILLTDQNAGPRPPFSRRWWSAGLPLELLRRRIDVFHGVDFAVPYLPVCPSVLTLHDLSPWLDEGWRRGAERVRRRTPPLLRLGLATMIVTPSEAVRRQAIDRFGLPGPRVVTIPLAASPRFQPVDSPPRQRPYFLYVGTLEPRKNLETIVRAWRRLRPHADVDLILAGRRREDFAGFPSEPGLEISGVVPDDDLPALYSGATAFLYPSYYEGFGLPVLEAMRCGAPVIVSRDPAIEEVTGDAGLRLDTRDTCAWTEAMRMALESHEWREGRRRAAIERAREFSWERTARMTREVYEDAIRRFGC